MAITDQILNIGGGYGNALSSFGNTAGSTGSIIKKIKANQELLDTLMKNII